MTKTLPLLTFIILSHTFITTSAAEPDETTPPQGNLLERQCEHNIPTYTCDECRYETGIVKLAPELLAATNGQPLIKLGKASKQPIEDVIETTGEVGLNEHATVRITAPVPGILRKVCVDSSTRVKAGDALLELESAELAEAIGVFLKNRTLAEVSRQNFERERILVASNVSAEVDLAAARIRLSEDTANLNATLQRLTSLGVSQEALAGMGDTSPVKPMATLSVRAPRDGIIIEKHITTGNRIAAGDTVLILSDPSTLWIWFDIQQRDLAPLLAHPAPGTIPITLTTWAFSGQTFTGHVEVVGPVQDTATRTIKGRALIDNPRQQLRPGMFCAVRLALGSDKTLAIPRSAILDDEGRNFVFKHLKDNYFIRQPVRKGRTSLDAVEIIEGLSEGETVVTEGSFLLKSDVLREKMGAGCAD